MEPFRKYSYVVNLVEKFQLDDGVYLVTRYYKTGDLNTYLETKNVDRLPEADARFLFKQIATGVRDLHWHGIVHRDLKHLNILISVIDGAPAPKIADFGMA